MVEVFGAGQFGCFASRPPAAILMKTQLWFSRDTGPMISVPRRMRYVSDTRTLPSVSRLLCSDCVRKVGQYNRDFAKQWIPKMDRDFGKDGKSLDIVKANKWMVEGKEVDKILNTFRFFLGLAVLAVYYSMVAIYVPTFSKACILSWRTD